MRALASIKSEFLGVLRNRKLLIAVIGVMLIPLLYSGTFLWAFWDPYGHVDRMPVAVVNQDKGAVLNGKQLNIGNDLVKNLKKKKSLNYQFVSEAQANYGLKKQDYYIKIEIPKDFSQNATTLESDHPKKLDLIYTPNQGFNYLSSKIGDSAITKIQDELSSTVTETYAQSMFQNLKDVANGLKKAGNGAGDLSDGIDKAKSGAGDLQTGIHSAQSGASDLSKGSEDVNTGAKQLQQNLAVLASKSVSFSQGVNSASAGSKQVEAGLQQFGAGLGQMKEGNAQLLAGAQKSEAGAKQVSDGLHSAASKMPELQNGSSQLAGGLSTLSSSMDKWKQGAASTKSGADTVSGGLQQAVDMVDHMADSTIDPVQKAKLEALKANLDQLSAGSSQVADGVAALSDNADKLKTASDQLAAGAGKLNQGQNQLAVGLNQLSAGAGQLAGGQEQLTQGLTVFGQKIAQAENGFNQLEGGSSSLAAGLDQLASGSLQMKDGTAKLANGSAQLAAGTDRLAGGSNDLKGGLSTLAGGSDQLTNGIGKLADGSEELSSQLNNGAKETGDVKANKKVYDMFAKPVNLKEDQMNPVPDYGTGFTPYFLSLSLFVGALMLSVIFPMLEPAGEPKNGFSWFAGKLGILLAVGIGQALLADIVLLKGLGLEVKSVPYFMMLSIFTSWTFLAIIQFLVTVLDNPGRFLGIILLILQLTSSAGTYPIELVPKILQKLNHFLPMSYTIAGFRAIISTGDFHFLWQNIACIAIFFIAFLCATLTYFMVKFKRQSQLQYQ